MEARSPQLNDMVREMRGKEAVSYKEIQRFWVAVPHGLSTQREMFPYRGASLLFESGVAKPLRQAEGNGGLTHSIRGAIGLDLIDGLVELQGQVLSRRTSGRCVRMRGSCQVRICPRSS